MFIHYAHRKVTNIRKMTHRMSISPCRTLLHQTSSFIHIHYTNTFRRGCCESHLAYEWEARCFRVWFQCTQACPQGVARLFISEAVVGRRSERLNAHSVPWGWKITEKWVVIVHGERTSEDGGEMQTWRNHRCRCMSSYRLNMPKCGLSLKNLLKYLIVKRNRRWIAANCIDCNDLCVGLVLS